MKASHLLEASKVTAAFPSSVWLLWDEALLTIVNPPKGIHKLLTYTHSALEQNEKHPWKRDVKRSRKRVFEQGTIQGVGRVLHTLQGYRQAITLHLFKEGIPFRVLDLRTPGLLPEPRFDLMGGFRFSQGRILRAALETGISGGIKAPTRFGKCFGKGTPVMMADGAIKAVEAIRTGELVMGPDLKPREVLGCTIGSSKLFKVTPSDGGESWVCNEDHILHVRHEESGRLENILVRDWVTASRGYRLARKMRKVVESNEAAIGFDVSPSGTGDYYGFAINDPEGLFLLGDGTVVHNTTLIINTLKAFPKVPTVLVAPGEDLLTQTTADLKKALPNREVKQIGGGSRVKYQSEDINVLSSDSMHKIDPGPIRLLLADEPHTIVSDSRYPHLQRFHLARKIWYGATPDDRFDGNDALLEGYFGPVLASITYKEAVREGAVEQIHVIMIDWPLDNDIGSERDRAYRDLFYMNPRIADCINYLSTEVIPREWQTLFFISTEKQADMLKNRLADPEMLVAMAKKFKNAEDRKKATETVRNNSVKRAVCSGIYVQGVTFHDLMCLVNVAGGGGSTSTIQRPGRLAEIRPGKTGGLMFDFLFRKRHPMNPATKGVEAMIRDSKARMAAYEKIGYKVQIAERSHIKTAFENLGLRGPGGI